jgi:hypothetical protein
MRRMWETEESSSSCNGTHVGNRKTNGSCNATHVGNRRINSSCKASHVGNRRINSSCNAADVGNRSILEFVQSNGRGKTEGAQCFITGARRLKIEQSRSSTFVHVSRPAAGEPNWYQRAPQQLVPLHSRTEKHEPWAWDHCSCIP